MKLIFKEDEYLSAIDVYTRLNISKSTWEKNRLKVLDHLRLYCDFEVLGSGLFTFFLRTQIFPCFCQDFHLKLLKCGVILIFILKILKNMLLY